MKKLLLSVSIASVLGLAGCSGDESIAEIKQQVEDAGGVQQPASRIIFDPSGGNLSVPNDLLFKDTTDGTLFLPGEKDATGVALAAPDYTDPSIALGALDGWATTSAFSVDVAMGAAGVTLAPAAFAQAGAVRLFEVNLGGLLSPVADCNTVASLHLCGDIVQELEYGQTGDFIAAPSDKKIVIMPMKPFKASQGYLLVLTNNIEDSEGNALRGSSTYETVRTDITTMPLPLPSQLGLQSIINSYEAGAVAASDLDQDSIIYTAAFTTQSVVDVFETTKFLMVNPLASPSYTSYKPSISAAPEIGTSPAPSISIAAVDYYTASLTVPFYGECSKSACLGLNDENETVALINGRWQAASESPVAQAMMVTDTARHLTRFNPVPAVQSIEDIPVQITIPKIGTKPDAGWPVVIAMHGLGGGKESTLAYANAYAAAGIATIAIDMPLHGERSFGFGAGSTGGYLVTATNVAYGSLIGQPTAFTDGDTLAFINVGSPLTVRDNFRQAILDNLALRLALNSMPDIAGISDTLDATKVSIQGLSLGGIVGTSVATYANSGLFNPATKELLAVPNYFALTNAALVAPAGGLAGSFAGSSAFSPVLFNTIVATDDFQELVDAANTQGHAEGTSDYNDVVRAEYGKFIPSFAFAIQTAVDSIDPINYGAALAASEIPVQVIEIVGDGADNLSDQTLPNRVLQLPLPNLDPLPIPFLMSGTEPLIASLGLDCVDSMTTGATSGVVRFTKGHHSSLGDSREQTGITEDLGFALLATMEMQAQVASFAATGFVDSMTETVTSRITVTNDDVVKACAP